MPDHVHMMISIAPKYAVSQVIGFTKRKSAIHLRVVLSLLGSDPGTFLRNGAFHKKHNEYERGHDNG
jgi:REP element-mobilizing transposase RayT